MGGDSKELIQNTNLDTNYTYIVFLGAPRLFNYAKDTLLGLQHTQQYIPIQAYTMRLR